MTLVLSTLSDDVRTGGRTENRIPISRHAKGRRDKKQEGHGGTCSLT